MKKISAVLLVCILLLSTGLVPAENMFSVPSHVSRFKQKLDPLPTLKTRQVGTDITVTVNGEVDYLLANWLGYKEEPEEIELKDGVGHVSTEGHTYQLGARWNNILFRVPIEKFFRYENLSDEDLKAYFDTLVQLNDSRVAGFDPSDMVIAHLVPEYRVRRTVNTYDAATNTFVSKSEILEHYPVTRVSDEMLQKMIAELPEDSHVEQPDGSFVDTLYCISESAYRSLAFEFGYNSEGSPDRAYLGSYHNYALSWKRNGELYSVTKILNGTDLFKTGIEGATSYVIWDNTSTDHNMFISDVVTYYPTGSDIATINAEYWQNGELRKYTISYPDGSRVTVPGVSYTSF